MPRNDQVTRQIILLRKLEGSRGATLQELSAALPSDLARHTRTIRGDLEALESTFLPAGGAAYVEQMHSYFSVGMGPHKIYRQHRQTIDQLSRAISQTHTVQMRYYTASRDKTSHREVDPYHTRHQELRQSNTRTVPDSKPVKPYNPWAGRIGHLPHRSQRLRSFSLPYNPPGLVKSRPRHWLRN